MTERAVRVGDRIVQRRTGREAVITHAFVQPADRGYPAVDVVEWESGTTSYRFSAAALLDGHSGWSLVLGEGEGGV